MNQKGGSSGLTLIIILMMMCCCCYCCCSSSLVGSSYYKYNSFYSRVPPGTQAPGYTKWVNLVLNAPAPFTDKLEVLFVPN